MIGSGSILGLLWLILGWKSGQKTGKLAVRDQVLMFWVDGYRRYGLACELDAAETVDQSSFVIYDLATVHLYIQSLDCFQILYLHPFIACTLADNGVSKPWL